MRPTTADDNVFDFNALLHPGTAFKHPSDVVCHAGLTTAEKRAILASWASDASAIASCPSLRSPAGLKKPVSSTKSSRPCANSTADPGILRVESLVGCAQPNVPWPPEPEGDE
ncbi:hypothetical protein ACVIHF_000729 [Bradyrhizobium sp. USDA 4506]